MATTRPAGRWSTPSSRSSSGTGASNWPPPLHLLRCSRLSAVREWTPEKKIGSCIRVRLHAQAALDGAYLASRDNFPVPSCVFIILDDPSTRSRTRFYSAVKQAPGKGQPLRASAWKPGIVFPSLAEAEAFLLGAGCYYPSKYFARSAQFVSKTSTCSLMPPSSSSIPSRASRFWLVGGVSGLRRPWQRLSAFAVA